MAFGSVGTAGWLSATCVGSTRVTRWVVVHAVSTRTEERKSFSIFFMGFPGSPVPGEGRAEGRGKIPLPPPRAATILFQLSGGLNSMTTRFRSPFAVLSLLAAFLLPCAVRAADPPVDFL